MSPTTVPEWLTRPLPVDAVADPALHAKIDELGARLPEGLPELHQALVGVRMFREYDAAANHAAVLLWSRFDACVESPDVQVRLALVTFVEAHLPPAALARLLRRVAKDASHPVRRLAARVLKRSKIREVALPAKKDALWDQTGWMAGSQRGKLSRHPTGRRVLGKFDLPVLPTLAKVRKLLDIRSPKQLGYFLLATDANEGPYSRFTIPKRDGADRTICAPKTQLRFVQRSILDQILAKVPTHDAAHGFITGRSTVTNATPHLGAKVLVKFDQKDFFPTLHYYRVVGLFARLGYPLDDARFSTDDESRRVAPTLARLCCYTPDPFAWNLGHTPQGAPTSPAISNLVCRGLDARLTGLAKRNEGVFTRYADDLTFSFRHTKVDLGRFRWWVDQICQQEGFLVNQAKFRVIRAAQRQVVTGIVVNDVLRVPRDDRRRFRAILHNCRTHGITSQARGRATFAAWMRGYAAYVHMVHPEEGAEMLREVAELLGPDTTEPTP